MSKIVIKIVSYQNLSETIKTINKITKDSFSDIKKKIDEHLPIFVGVLFYNDHQEVAKNLARIIEELTQIHCNFNIYELDELANVNDLNEDDINIIDKQTLFNILDSYEREIKRQENL